MSYSIESITESIGARRMGNAPATIDWLLTDSRSLNFPEETLFFALTTKRNDGARYITDLYARGVRNFVLSEESFRLMDNGQLTIDNAMQRDCSQPAESPAKTGGTASEPVPDTGHRYYGKQRQDRCERMAAPVAQSGTCHYPFSPQL